MSKKIVLIDDEVNILKVLSTMLEVSGYLVYTASNGVEGLKLIKENEPDLIIMDVIMPEQDGYTTVKKIKAFKLEEDEQLRALGDIPIIVMTARGPGMQDIFELEGIAAYITKPFEPEEILSEVAKILGEA